MVAEHPERGVRAAEEVEQPDRAAVGADHRGVRRAIARLQPAGVGVPVVHMLDHLDLVRAAGSPLPGEPRLVASAMFCRLDQFAYTWLVGGGDGSRPSVDDEEAIETLTDLLHRGIAGTPPDAAGSAEPDRG